MQATPLVSVVTPFYNTRDFLAECIESVLRQTYQNWEYILVDNQSTDGSSEIAAEYTTRFPEKIRIIHTESFLSQVQNYNFALSCISAASQYTKMVQADDWLYPECIELMVALAETNPSIGLVSSYYLNRNRFDGYGLPVLGSEPSHRAVSLPGKEVARRYLRTGNFVFGSPTTVMYRSTLVRSQQPFYDESLLHEDTEKCMQILEHWDFGFVHQVMSFLRTHESSITFSARNLRSISLDWYIIVQRYASSFLGKEEALALRKKVKREYYELLAFEALRRRDGEFWQYQERGLRTLGETLEWHYIALLMSRELLWMAANPVATTARALRFLKRKVSQEEVPQAQ